jgi:hypothetical protein
LLGRQTLFASETAVMRGDVFVADSFAEMACDSFGQPARVNKDERGVVLANQLRQSIVNFIPNFAGHHCLQRRLGHSIAMSSFLRVCRCR